MHGTQIFDFEIYFIFVGMKSDFLHHFAPLCIVCECTYVAIGSIGSLHHLGTWAEHVGGGKGFPIYSPHRPGFRSACRTLHRLGIG